MTSREITFKHAGVTVRVRPRPFNVSQREYNSKTRVYGAIESLASAKFAEVERWTETPVTAQLERTNPREAVRIMRGYRSARRAAVTESRVKLVELLAHLVTVLDGSEPPTVARFSTKAGCSCDCSPGFILNERVTVNGVPTDIWISEKP